MNYTMLTSALSLTYSHEACLQILEAAAQCYREQTILRWYPLLINRIFAQVIDNPEFFEADQVDPVWDTLCEEARRGLAALISGDVPAVSRSADRLTEAFCALP